MSENQKNQLGLIPKNGEITFIMPNTEAIGQLKNAEKGRKLTCSYFKKDQWLSKIGEVVNCFFLGFKEAKDSKGEPYFLAKLHDGENAFVCGQTILVQSLQAVPIGQGVEIVCTGSSKTNGNEIPLFEVTELNINLFDNQPNE